MKISLITPAKRQSKAGNRTTAVRWARILRNLGHQVQVAVNYAQEPADLMVALHAWRSAESIMAFRQRYPNHPLIVALTGMARKSNRHSRTRGRRPHRRPRAPERR